MVNNIINYYFVAYDAVRVTHYFDDWSLNDGIVILQRSDLTSLNRLRYKFIIQAILTYVKVSTNDSHIVIVSITIV